MVNILLASDHFNMSDVDKQLYLSSYMNSEFLEAVLIL